MCTKRPFFFFTLSAEWGLCDESTDFLYFPHRKTKVEKNQEDTLERPQCIKEDEDDAVVPDRNCKPPFIFREPEEVKVHFLGLKKVSRENVDRYVQQGLLARLCLS